MNDARLEVNDGSGKVRFLLERKGISDSSFFFVFQVHCEDGDLDLWRSIAAKPEQYSAWSIRFGYTRIPMDSVLIGQTLANGETYIKWVSS